MGIDLINFLNRQISVPEAPTINDSRTRVSIPDLGDFGFDMPQDLARTSKQRLEQMGSNFPHDGMTPEEVGTLNGLVEASALALKSAESYVKATKQIGEDTVKMYELEQEHKENYFGFNNKVQEIDTKHVKALGDWQSKTDKNVSAVRERLAYLKVKAQVA